MAKEEEQGFVIRDKRGRGEGPTASEPGRPAASSPAPDPTHEADHSHEPHPPVTFASFVFSLSTSALMLMGEQLDTRQGKIPVNLPQAKEIIDILSVLEAKTKGNLNQEEQAMLTDMLYALRMKYVDLASGKKPPFTS
ncbi:MAG: DUF1844 domain-containing protein [Nitrospiraceae bacterium]|nr:DUF1844 domain-containing protein [Nitrospiraceae bacterium]MSR25000.1 DUF1844 domain-containing protein [Nitrospiraceae bacterium]